MYDIMLYVGAPCVPHSVDCLFLVLAECVDEQCVLLVLVYCHCMYRSRTMGSVL